MLFSCQHMGWQSDSNTKASPPPIGGSGSGGGGNNGGSDNNSGKTGDCKKPTKEEVLALLEDFKGQYPECMRCGADFSFDNCFRRRDHIATYLKEKGKQLGWCPGVVTNISIVFNEDWKNWGFHTCVRVDCIGDDDIYCDPHDDGDDGTTGDGMDIFCGQGWAYICPKDQGGKITGKCKYYQPGDPAFPWWKCDRGNADDTHHIQIHEGNHPLSGTGTTCNEFEDHFCGYNKCLDACKKACNEDTDGWKPCIRGCIASNPDTNSQGYKDCKAGCQTDYNDCWKNCKRNVCPVDGKYDQHGILPAR